MQDENTKRSGARLTSLLTVFAVLVCMLSLMILPASAASDPTAEQFYGVWSPNNEAVPSGDLELTGLHFIVAGVLCDEFLYDSETAHFEWKFNGEIVHSSLVLEAYYAFDFGNTPVEIPEVMFDFFVENFDYTPSSYVRITANGGDNSYTLLDGASSLFRMATGFIGNIGQTIMDTPLLLAFIALPVVGLGVGLFKRLRGV